MNKEKFLKLAKQAILKNYEPNKTYGLGAPVWYDYDVTHDIYKAVFRASFGYQDNLLLVNHSPNWDEDNLITIREFEECRYYAWNF